MSNTPTPALAAEYNRVIPAKFVTKRDGSPMACMTCGNNLEIGGAFAATNGSGWVSYCATCATSPIAQVAGLVNRVETLVAPLGDDVPDTITLLVEAVTPLVERVLDGDTSNWLAAKRTLLTIREQVGIAKKAAAPATVRPNGYGGKCGTCKVWVEPQAGRIEKVGGRWVTYCLDACQPQAQAPAVTVAEGLYLDPVIGSIRKVYTTQNGNLGVKALTTVNGKGSFLYVRGGVAVVAQDLAAGTARLLTQAEAQAFGRQYGFCVACALDLTDDRSLAVGYGPVCAKNYNWFYPNQAEAAEMLARPQGMLVAPPVGAAVELPAPAGLN